MLYERSRASGSICDCEAFPIEVGIGFLPLHDHLGRPKGI